MAGVFLLNGASSSTALGLLSLMYAMNGVTLLVDDVPEQVGGEASALLINNALYSTIAFGNLLNQEWATIANNVGAAWALLNAAFILTGKFKEVSTIKSQLRLFCTQLYMYLVCFLCIGYGRFGRWMLVTAP